MSNLAIDDEMLTLSDDEEDDDARNLRELRNLRRQATITQQQMASMQDMINQLLSQLMATLNEKKVLKKPKMAPPKKYEGGRYELRPFLTNMDLYCEFNEVLTDQGKILMASTYMKGRAANWIQPYVEDYVSNSADQGTRAKTQSLFAS